MFVADRWLLHADSSVNFSTGPRLGNALCVSSTKVFSTVEIYDKNHVTDITYIDMKISLFYKSLECCNQTVILWFQSNLLGIIF